MSWDWVYAEMNGLAELEIDWDGDGADPMRLGVLDDMRAVAKDEEARGRQPPFAVYLTAGGAGMWEWDGPLGLRTSAMFMGDGTVETLFFHGGSPTPPRTDKSIWRKLEVSCLGS